MRNRRHVLTLASLVMTSLLLFHFQNCAPSGGKAAGGDATPAGGGTVGLVDDYGKAQLQFVSEETDLQDDVPAADVSGLCNRDHEGAKLRWTVWTDGQNAQPLLSGTSVCHGGEFDLNLTHLDQMVCGVSHLIEVEGDWGGSSLAHVQRRCQPLASQEIAAPEDSPLGTTCALEYTPDSEASSACQQVCYRASKVVFEQAMDSAECSSLAAGLAGP